MLLSFRFANHRSFKDEQQLNLTPAYDPLPGEPAERHPALRVTGVFGANASGKSNLIDALAYMSRLVGRSDREVEPGLDIRRLAIKRSPFRLDRDRAAEPSSYVVDLQLDGVRYTFGFILDDERIREEWLFCYPLNRKRVVFQRILDEFSWGEESSHSELRGVADIVAPTALFLSTAARFGQPRAAERGQAVDAPYRVTHAVYEALYFGIKQPESRFPPRHERWEWLQEPGTLDRVAELLRAADIGLRDIFFVTLSESPQAESASNVPPSTSRLSREETRLLFLHNGTTAEAVFDAADESEGTLQLLRLARSAIGALKYGDVVLVDEIDASLHPLLTAKLIGLFRSGPTNPRGAQLVFTSHDATLLGALDGEEVLRRDEIWFTEKNADGVSALYPLAEFKPRKDGENRQRRYLNGSYGAIPELSMQMFESALASMESTEHDE